MSDSMDKDAEVWYSREYDKLVLFVKSGWYGYYIDSGNDWYMTPLNPGEFGGEIFIGKLY